MIDFCAFGTYVTQIIGIDSVLDKLWSICWYVALEFLTFMFCFVIQLENKRYPNSSGSEFPWGHIEECWYIWLSTPTLFRKKMPQRGSPSNQSPLQNLDPDSLFQDWDGIQFALSFCKCYHNVYRGNSLSKVLGCALRTQTLNLLNSVIFYSKCGLPTAAASPTSLLESQHIPPRPTESEYFCRVTGWSTWKWMFQKHCCSCPVLHMAGPFCFRSSLTTQFEVSPHSPPLTSFCLNSVSWPHISFLITARCLSCFCAFYLLIKS